MAEKKSWRDYADKSANHEDRSSNGWRSYAAEFDAKNISDRVNNWIKGHNDYVKNYTDRYSGRKFDGTDAYVSDSADWLKKASEQKGQMVTEAYDILQYLDKNGSHLNQDWVKSVRDTILKLNDQQTKMLDTASRDNKYWSAFGEDAELLEKYKTAEGVYNYKQRASDYYKKYKDKSYAEISSIANGMADGEEKDWLRSYAYNVDYDEKSKENLQELADLYDEAFTINQWYNEYQMGNVPYDAHKMEVYNRFKNEYGGDIYALSGYINDAQDIQNIIGWESVSDHQDFKEKSGSVNAADIDLPSQMEEDEIAVYNYYYATEGKKKADAYLKALDSTLKARKYEEIAKNNYEYANENWYQGVLASLGSVGTSLLSGVEYVGDVLDYGWQNLTGQDARMDKNTMSIITNAFRKGVSDQVDWKVSSESLGIEDWDAYDFLYNTTMSGIDSLAASTMGKAGPVVLGLSAAAQGTNDALERGMNSTQAFWNGLFSGFFEGFFESFSIGNFNALKEMPIKAGLKGMNKEAVKTIAKNLGKSMLVNASEETATEVANIVYDTLANGKFANYTLEELKNGAWKQALGQVAEAGASGVLMGFGMGGGGMAIGRVNGIKQENDYALKQYGDRTDEIIQEGLESDTKSSSYKLATKYQQQVRGKDGKEGTALTGAQIRKLLEANQKQITPKDMKKIQQAAEKRLTELGQTEDVAKLAELATKWATGQKLSKAEKSLLANSKNGSRVSSELLPKNIDSGDYTSAWAEDIGTREVNAQQYNKKNIEKVRTILEQMANIQEDPATYKPLESRVGDETTYTVSESGNATIRETDKAIDLSKPEIVDFVRDKSGKVTDMVLNVDGKQVKASEIDYADDNQAYLFEAVSKIENITPGDAQAIVRGYDPSSGLSVGEYLNGMDEAYTYGYHGYSEADMGAGNFAPKLSSKDANSAYLLGKGAKSAKNTGKSEAIKRMRTAVVAEVEKAVKKGKEAPNPSEMTITYNAGNGKVVDFNEAGLKLTTKQKAAPALAKVFHEMGLGTNFEFYASYKKNGARKYLDDNGIERNAPSGVYRKSDGTIRIDLNAYNGKGLTIDVMAHELTHFIQQWSDEKYNALADFLIKTYEKTDMSMHQRVLREQARLKGIRGKAVSYNEAFDEVVANAMSKMLADEKVMERLNELKAQDMDLAQKLWEKLKEFINDFLGISEKLFYDATDLEEMNEDFEQLKNLWAEAFVEASENFQASLAVSESQKNPTAEDGVRYSSSSYDYSKSFAEQLEDYQKGQFPKGDTLIVGATPEVFRKIGMAALPVTLNTTHVDYALNGTKDFDHHLGQALLEQLPEAIKKPVVIMTSGTKANSSIVAMLEIRHNGKQIVVPVAVDGFGMNNGLRIDSNAITSVYGKNYSISKVLHDAIDQENKGVFRLYYLDQNKATALLRGAKVPMPKMPATYDGGFIHSLTDPGSPVKSRISDATQSQQFKRWFGDWQNNPKAASKVVNADGTPMIMYHGSPAQFTIFDKKKAKSSGQYGRGFYFTNSQSHAGTYGQQYSVYLNIRNPLEHGRVTVSRAQVQKFVENVAENEDYSIENYGTYDVDAIINTIMGKSKAVDAFQVIQDINATAIGDMVEATELFNQVAGTDFDGIVVPTETVAFYPNQIKSATDNIGTFDGSNPDIRYSSQETDADAEGFKDYDIVSAVYTIRNEKAKRGHDLVKVGNMPTLYRELFGLRGDVYVSNEHLYQNMVSRATAEAEGRFKIDDSADYHELGEEKVINAIEQFQDPLAIMESLKDYDEPRLVAILDEKGNDGQNLMAVMELYAPLRPHGVSQLRNHVLITIYEKSSLPDYIEKTVDKGRVLHKKEGSHLTRQADLQLVGEMSNETLKKNVAQFNKKVKAFKEKNGIQYSTQETDNISNRDLLANAFEGIVNGSDEYKLIQQYKGRIKVLNEYEEKLSELNREIYKLTFGTKGVRDTKRIKELQSKAKEIAGNIDKNDKKLLALEASEPLRKVIERERKKASQKTKDHVKEIQQNKKVRAEQTELRHKIRKAVRDLDKILNRGNKKQNVKEDLQPVVANALKAADILFTDHYGNYDMLRNGIIADMSDSEEALVKSCAKMLKDLDAMPTDGYENWKARQEAENRLKAKMSGLKEVFARERKRLNNTKVSTILGELADAYASLEKSEQRYVQGAYIEAVHNFLKSLQSEVGGTVVNDMTKAQLESVYAAYKMVLTTVRKANQMFNEELKMSREQMGNAVIQEVIKAGGDHGLWTKAESARSQFDWNNTKPVWVANRIGSDTFGKLMQGLFNGQYNFAVDIDGAKKFKLKMDEKYHPRNWDTEKQYEFESSTGSKFSLNLQQIMSLYAFSKRDQAYSHLRNGGFVFEGNSTVIVDKNGRKKTYIYNGATSYKLNEATLNDIINSLTEEQKAYADEMQKYLSEVMGAKGNEVSMQLYGIKMFNEQFYFPLRSSGAYMERAKEAEMKKQQGQINLVNSGFTHAVKPEAKNPIILSGFMDIWAEHCNEMSMYHSMVLPMEDFRKVYNYSTQHEEGADSHGVYAAIKNAYGQAATDYIDQLYRELNAGATVDPRETPWKSLISKFKKASVMLSASVVVQQFSSIGRAYAVIDPKYFVGTKVNSGTQMSVADEMKKYAPVAIIKEMGGFDTGTKGSAKSYIMAEKYGEGDGFVGMVKDSWQGKKERIKGLGKDEQYRGDIMGYLPQKADEKTWVAIWEAVKRETKAKHSDMDVKSDEFLKLAGERFSEVIEKTQVYDSVLARSANMRSKGNFMAMATAFMAEPTTTINLLEDAIRRGNKKYMARAFGSVAVSIVLNNALASIVYAMRDDDEDETFMEKYFQSFTSGMIDDINPMTYYPFLKDVYSLFQGYDVERSDMSVIADLRDALKRTVSLIGKDTSSMDDEKLAEHWKTVNGALLSIVDAGCSVFGVPFKNVRRDANGIINAFTTIGKDLSGEITTTWLSFWDKVGSAAKDTVPVYAWTKDEAKTDKIYNAIVSGDKAYLGRLKSTYKTDSAYQSAVRKALRENDPRIHDAAQARYEGRNEEYKRIFREIQKEGKFSFDDIMSAVNSEESKIRNGVEPEKVTSEYSAGGFVEAVAMGDTKSAQAMRDDIIATHVANGKTQAEAEKAFESDVSTSVGEAYTSGLLDKDRAENMLQEYAGKDEEEAASKVNYWAFGEKHREYKDVFNESHVAKYQEFAEPVGISVAVYAQFIKGTKGLADIKDEWGDVEVSKRDQVLDVIDSLPLTWQQKDALYLAAEYAESKLWDVPW